MIKRLLDRAEVLGPPISKPRGLDRRRPLGEDPLLPEGEYWLPILQIIAEAGGAKRGRDVISALESRLADRLTERDHDKLEMGEVRWMNRARFARLRMKELGLISNESPRGVWEITEKGREYMANPPEPGEGITP